MIRRRLFLSDQLFDLGQDELQEPGFAEHFQSVAGSRRFRQQACQFMLNPLGADFRDARRHSADRGKRVRLNVEFEGGSEPDGAQHSEVIF